eukprot:5082426-Pyramimonas_sp.AAC.1
MDTDEGFWLRGMMPAAWTAVPPPVSVECWTVKRLNEVSPGCWGEDTAECPLIISGDASGGADSSSN